MESTGLSYSWFIRVLVALVALYRYSDVDPELRPGETQLNETLKEYDFVIVGAGSAGSVVAHRLSENSNWTVLLIEAGGDESVVSDVPLLRHYRWKSDFTWNYTTVQQRFACLNVGGECLYPRGRVLGGSSTINGMLYVRGNPADFDDWASEGNPGWSYHDVLPYFTKSEDLAVDELQNSPYHGRGGLLTVKHSEFASPLQNDFLWAAKSMGFSYTDYNGLSQIGYSKPQFTMRGPSRCSAAKAFLRTTQNRTNLHILQRAQVLKVLIENGQAKGVLVFKEGQKVKLYARQEVILSAGAVGSPQLLMLSGVGPRHHLESQGIPVQADLPVGRNLQDHLTLNLIFKINSLVALNKTQFINYWSSWLYASQGLGPLASGGGHETVIFASVTNSSTVPDVALYLNSFESSVEKESVFRIQVVALKPKSRGSVELSSGDPLESPRIDPRYLEDPLDLNTTLEACHLALQLARTAPLRKHSPRLYKEAHPLCEQVPSEDAYLRCLIANYSLTMYHPVGSCRMGPAHLPDSVVAHNLRVHGIQRLRVIDASIMPSIVRANTNAAAIMIGERGAQFIIDEYSSTNNSTLKPITRVNPKLRFMANVTYLPSQQFNT